MSKCREKVVNARFSEVLLHAGFSIIDLLFYRVTKCGRLTVKKCV